MDRLAHRVAARYHRATLTHLGRLPIGQVGEKAFGPFTLTWRVDMDHVAWELVHVAAFDRPKFKGALKYVGWNRFEVEGQVEAFCSEWPAIRAAINYVYYVIGPQIGLEQDVADGSWTDPEA